MAEECRRNEASLKAALRERVLMLVACRLAALSALEGHYAGVKGRAQYAAIRPLRIRGAKAITRRRDRREVGEAACSGGPSD